MFKRIAFILILSLVLSISAQGVKFDKPGTQNYWIPNSGSSDIFLYFTNLSSSTSRVVYEKISVDWPSKWIVQFCDDINCHTDFVDRDTFQPLAKNAKADIHVTLYPQGYADTAHFKYSIYLAGQPTQRDTVTVNIYIPWGAATHKPTISNFNIYPNPAATSIGFLSTQNSQFKITNLQGVNVLQGKVVNGKNDIELSTLTDGIYFIQIPTKEGIIRKQFIKI
jgi:hypothetical protein